MRDAKSIVVRFFTGRETGDSTFLSDAGHFRTAAGDHFMRVGLMSDIPDYSIDRGVEHIMKSNGEFDYAKAGTEVSTTLGNRSD